MIMPHIAAMELMLYETNKSRKGVMVLVLFDGASNVQKVGWILAVKYPCITIVHGAEHVMSLFFKDVYAHISFWCFNRIHLHIPLTLCLFDQVHIIQIIIGLWKKIEECIRFLQVSSACHVLQVQHPPQSRASCRLHQIIRVENGQ
jgi:hypothetical protein